MDKKITKNSFLDLSILIPYLILSAVGLLMVFSATVPYQINRGLSPYRLAISQGVFGVEFYSKKGGGENGSTE